MHHVTRCTTRGDFDKEEAVLVSGEEGLQGVSEFCFLIDLNLSLSSVTGETPPLNAALSLPTREFVSQHPCWMMVHSTRNSSSLGSDAFRPLGTPALMCTQPLTASTYAFT